MTREEAKKMFRDDVDSYGKPKRIMGKIDQIFDEFEQEKKLLTEKIVSSNMRVIKTKEMTADCPCCGSTLGYTLEHIHQGVKHDYKPGFGDGEYPYYFIRCKVCKEEVEVPNCKHSKQ